MLEKRALPKYIPIGSIPKKVCSEGSIASAAVQNSERTASDMEADEEVAQIFFSDRNVVQFSAAPPSSAMPVAPVDAGLQRSKSCDCFAAMKCVNLMRSPRSAFTAANSRV